MATVTGITSAKATTIDNASIVSGAVNAAGHLILTLKGGGTIDVGSVVEPPGTVVMYAGSSAPSGWLICSGQAVSRTTYAALFAAIGTVYGTGDGSTTFNVPSMEARTPRQQVAALGATGGATTHTHTLAGHTHTGPSHDHDLATGSPQGVALATNANPGTGDLSWNRVVTAAWNATHKVASMTVAAPGATGLTIASALQGKAGTSGTGATGGSSVASDTGSSLDPYLNLNFIIKT